MSTDNPQQEDTPGCTPPRSHSETPSDDHEWMEGEQLPILPEETQVGGDTRTGKEMEAGRHAAQRPIYAELNFAEKRPVPPPTSDMCVAGYAEVSQA